MILRSGNRRFQSDEPWWPGRKCCGSTLTDNSRIESLPATRE
ncbi:hypothetical protein ECDEC8B_2784 [Escherichia coli DEC8B]|nr:hypothetical protein ECDEC8B_2784 [Escherichia coli DEC8B]